MTGKIIVVEGIEATGKSAVAEHISHTLGGVYMHCPTGMSELTGDIYTIIKKHKDLDEHSKRALLVATHIENIKLANRLKAEGRTVVMDRSMLSFFVYQQFQYEEFNQYVKVNHIPEFKPDMAIVLMAERDTVIERMKHRENNDELDEYFKRHFDMIYFGYRGNLDKFYPDCCVIYTDNKTKPDVIKVVDNVLKFL